jgi:hypothetical protein
MSELSNIEELTKRKEQLLLEQEIARLERKQNLGKSANWSWVWVGPLALIGAFLLIVGLDDGNAVPIVLALFALGPVVMKLFFKRAS